MCFLFLDFVKRECVFFFDFFFYLWSEESGFCFSYCYFWEIKRVIEGKGCSFFFGFWRGEGREENVFCVSFFVFCVFISKKGVF